MKKKSDEKGKSDDIMVKINEKIAEKDKKKEQQKNELINDIEKKLNDDEKIEIMTQFMLDPTSSATKLLEKRRQMYELQEALQQDKEKLIDKEATFKKSEEELRMRDEEFHKKIVEYYKNSYEKRTSEKNSYQQKLINENNLQKQLEEEIKNLESSNKKLKSNLETMKNINDSLKEYEEYLKKVKDKQPENYSDVTDIINKYKTLENTLNDLEEAGKELNALKEEDRINFRNKKAEYENKINVVLKEITTYQNKLKEQKEKKKILENDVSQDEKRSNNISSSLEQILLAIQNIYNKCVEKKNWTHHDLKVKEKPNWADPEQRVRIAKAMLENINHYLEDYVYIEENCRKEIQNSNKK